MTDMTISKTILSQLGGGKFIAMTGAKMFVGSDDGLSFRLPIGKVNHFKVTLTPTDEYRLVGSRIRGLKVTQVNFEEGVQWTELRETFEKMTGLHIRL